MKNLINKKGFTLIEIIVVLVILAILAAIAVPALTGYIDRANERKLISETHTAVTAIQTWATMQFADKAIGQEKLVNADGNPILTAFDPTSDEPTFFLLGGNIGGNIQVLRKLTVNYYLNTPSGGRELYRSLTGYSIEDDPPGGYHLDYSYIIIDGPGWGNNDETGNNGGTPKTIHPPRSEDLDGEYQQSTGLRNQLYGIPVEPDWEVWDNPSALSFTNYRCTIDLDYDLVPVSDTDDPSTDGPSTDGPSTATSSTTWLKVVDELSSTDWEEKDSFVITGVQFNEMNTLTSLKLADAENFVVYYNKTFFYNNNPRNDATA